MPRLILPLIVLAALVAGLVLAWGPAGIAGIDGGLHRERIAGLFREHALLAMLGLFVLQVALAALAVPGSSVLLLAAGAGYGLVGGTLLCLTACTLGATLAMLGTRHLFRESIEVRYGSRLAGFNRKMVENGGYYLFSLRMVPVIPFPLVNLLAGLTPVPVRTFFWASFAGMLAGTAIYVQAGVDLAHAHSFGDLLSPGVFAALALASLLPLAARRLRPGRSTAAGKAG